MRRARASPVAGDEARLSLMRQPVAEFATRAPVVAPSSMPIREAARLMTQERVSALLIVDDGQLAGIVTDRDLRARCLAADVDARAAVAQIMTRDVHRIAPDAAAFEALLGMTRAGVHHLPVVDASGVRGLVSATDLTRWQSANPVYLAGAVRRCDTLEALVRASADLPALLVHLVGDGAGTSQIGQALSSVGDAIVCRLIELAQQRLGPAPLPFAWLSGGSLGRHEQALHSDQDSALILHDAYREGAHGAWFAEFARFVGDGLDACGYRYCPGKVMAANPEWRRPLADWIDTAAGWIRHCDRKSSMLAANLIDMRSVCGDAALWTALQRELLLEGGRQQAFLAHMAANALTNRPPLGMFRKLVLIAEGEHANTLDIKRQGLIPISDMARIHALAIGVPALGTVARLHAVAGTAELSASGAAEMEEAFEYLGGVRLRHQARQVRRAQVPDNYIAPDSLGALERKQIKAVFGVIAELQAALARRYPQCV